MFKVIDDFLPKLYSDQIFHDVWNELQWSYCYNTSRPIEGMPIPYVIDNNTYDYGQFECVMLTTLNKMQNAPHHAYYFEFIKPMVYIAQNHIERQIVSVERAKFNFMLQQPHAPEYHYNIAHKDTTEKNYYSMIYYVNDSDGDTFLFNEYWDEINDKPPEKLTLFNRVTPKRNRAVIFDSNRFHASSSPRLNKERLVINFVLGIQPNN
jgi:hypothetical protein